MSILTLHSLPHEVEVGVETDNVGVTTADDGDVDVDNGGSAPEIQNFTQNATVDKSL